MTVTACETVLIPAVISPECTRGDCRACDENSPLGNAENPCEHNCHPPFGAATEPDGQWMVIAFMGHNELTGYVTEITVGGQPGFHIDLPEKVWGGNPLAWEEYAGSALYSRRPVSAESVRAAWEAQRRRAELRRQQDAEWEQRALAGTLTTEGGDDERPCGCGPTEECGACREERPF